jgi:hypothetical protein
MGLCDFEQTAETNWKRFFQYGFTFTLEIDTHPTANGIAVGDG